MSKIKPYIVPFAVGLLAVLFAKHVAPRIPVIGQYFA